MRAVRGVRAITSVVLILAAAHLTRAQEATSANLPDQFQTGEMIEAQKPKSKKSESTRSTIVTAPNKRTAPLQETAPAAEQPPLPTAPTEEKRPEPNRSTSSMPPNEKPTTPIEREPSEEEQAAVTAPPAKKIRPKKRPRPVLQQEATTISAPVPMSLSVAQSMAITAPLPEYPYEAKRRNLRGSGTCLVTVDTATGTVTDATMSQSTGVPMLDKLTTQTFKSWRFKRGTVSEVRVPISYE